VARPSPSTAVALALPLLLAVVVAGIAITARVGGLDRPGPDTSPLVLAPVDAPQAAGPDCAGLLAGLDGDLPAGGATLPVRSLAPPQPPGARAWAASPDPVVLRCGLPRPPELTPTSALLQIDGVQGLRLDDGTPGGRGWGGERSTYVAVDRPVYVALTFPTGVGSGPVQAVSDVVRTRLPATPVAVSP
jgi:Protein of unknown function (DUF3515)